MSVEARIGNHNALSKEQIGANCAKTKRLLFRSFNQELIKEFLEQIEDNPVYQDFVDCLAHGIKLLKRKSMTRTMSDVTSTLTMLLKYGAKWYGDDLVSVGTTTPYHVICLLPGDHHELLDLMIKEIGRVLVDAEDDCENTALMYAVQSANINCVKTLIAHGADVNILVKRGDIQYGTSTEMITDIMCPLIDSINLLHPNCHYSSNIIMEIFDVLLDGGADVNRHCYYYRRTPVMYAVCVGNTKCVEKLIEKGALLNTTDEFGYTVWTLAAYSGNVDMLKCLLEDNGINKNSVDEDGLSVLYWALQSDNIEAVRYLLNLGVTVTSVELQEGVEQCKVCRTKLSCHYVTETQLDNDPYMLAICENKADMVKLMEEHGCKLFKSHEILTYAIRNNSMDVVNYLLGNHAYSLNYDYIEKDDWERNYPDDHQNLLTTACQRSSVKMIKLLLHHGADPSNKYGINKCLSALNVAITCRHVEIIACFIRSGVSVDDRWVYPDIGNVLPFESAVWFNHIYAAEMLLLAGCSSGTYSLDISHMPIDLKMRKLLKQSEVHKNKVLPLAQRCRKVILNHLSPQADKKIAELPLPPPLIKYLSIPELDDIVETFNNDPHASDVYVK